MADKEKQTVNPDAVNFGDLPKAESPKELQLKAGLGSGSLTWTPGGNKGVGLGLQTGAADIAMAARLNQEMAKPGIERENKARKEKAEKDAAAKRKEGEDLNESLDEDLRRLEQEVGKKIINVVGSKNNGQYEVLFEDGSEIVGWMPNERSEAIAPDKYKAGEWKDDYYNDAQGNAARLERFKRDEDYRHTGDSEGAQIRELSNSPTHQVTFTSNQQNGHTVMYHSAYDKDGKLVKWQTYKGPDTFGQERYVTGTMSNDPTTMINSWNTGQSASFIDPNSRYGSKAAAEQFNTQRSAADALMATQAVPTLQQQPDYSFSNAIQDPNNESAAWIREALKPRFGP